LEGEDDEGRSTGPKRSKFQQQKQSDYVFSDDSDDGIQKVLKQSALEGMGYKGAAAAAAAAMETEETPAEDPYSAGIEYL
jgi:hypothetical protein